MAPLQQAPTMHKTFLPTTLLILLPALVHGQALAQDVASKITAAHVFLQGAQITRTAKTTLPEGTSTLVFTGLAQGLDPRSIQLSGKGNFIILGIGHRTNYLSESPKKKELDVLTGRMKKLDKDLALEKAMQEVWANEEQLLLKNSAVGGQQNGVTVAQLTGVNDYIRERLRTVKVNWLGQQEKIAGLQEDKDKLQKQINALQGVASRPTGEVVVDIQATAAMPASFTLSYFVPQAGWVPAYDLRTRGAGHPMQLAMKAQVTNNSGEDWEQVAMSFSSGNPTQGGVMPTLVPWTLLPFQPVYRPMGSGAAPSAAAKTESLAYDQDAAKAGPPPVTVAQQAITVEYAIRMPFSVPSDGNPHTVVIQEHEMPASYMYFATPKLDKDAFLYARVTGWEDLRLLNGEAHVFLEGTYVGKSYLQLDLPKDTLEIGLGRDKGVVVERVKRAATDQKALLGNSRTVAIGWDIRVRNTKDRAIQLELRDQYPLSGQSEIEVKLTESGGASVDPAKGSLTWQMAIPPGKTEQVGFAYTVKYPKGLRPVLE